MGSNHVLYCCSVTFCRIRWRQLSQSALCLFCIWRSKLNNNRIRSNLWFFHFECKVRLFFWIVQIQCFSTPKSFPRNWLSSRHLECFTLFREPGLLRKLNLLFISALHFRQSDFRESFYLDEIKITYLFCRKSRSEHSVLDGPLNQSSASRHASSSHSDCYTVRGRA